MHYDLTDEQRVELIKNWWKKYGLTTIFGIILGTGMVLGWQYWTNHRNKQSAEASLAYMHMLSAKTAGQWAAVEHSATLLKTDFSHSPYAIFASFVLAQHAVQDSKLDIAAIELRWAIEQANDDSLKQSAKLRLARVYLAQKQYSLALETLDKVYAKTFLPAINEVRGDIYLAQGEKAKAYSSYKQALEGLPSSDVSRPLLQMKFADLTQAPTETKKG